VTALLDAASELDGEDRGRRRFRRALLATLAFAGLRVGELLALQWTDVNLASGKIRVRQSKTSAGVRTVDVQPELRDELLSWKASTRHGEPSDFVFPTSTGRPDNRNNVRRRVLVRAVERANERIVVAHAAAGEAVAARAAPVVRVVAHRRGRGRVLRHGSNGPRRQQDDDGRVLAGAEVEASAGARAAQRAGTGSGIRPGRERARNGH
jgi:integrase